MSFLYHRYGSMQANAVMHEVKWLSAGNDGTIKVVSLYFIYSYVLFS